MSNLIAEKMHDILEIYLKTPNKTIWNCTYDSLLQIQNIMIISNGHIKIFFILVSSNGHTKMINLMDFCEIQRFTNEEIQLILEYCEL